MALTRKQHLWIDFYLGETNGNASEAARLAGYSDPGQSGWMNKKNIEIQDEIDRRLAAHSLSSTEVLSRLAEQARGPSEFIEWLDPSRPYVNIERAKALNKLHLVKSIKYTNSGQCIVEFYDAQAALVQLGRYHKLWTDKSEGALSIEGILGYEVVAPDGSDDPSGEPETPV